MCLERPGLIDETRPRPAGALPRRRPRATRATRQPAAARPPRVAGLPRIRSPRVPAAGTGESYLVALRSISAESGGQGKSEPSRGRNNKRALSMGDQDLGERANVSAGVVGFSSGYP